VPADPYEVLGLDHGASYAEVRAAYRRLVQKHHPDKNPGDNASGWIFREVQRAYETLCDANDVRSAGQERPPYTQEDDARARADRNRQREQQAEEAETERYEQWERQQAEDARRRWERERAKHAAHGEGGTESLCDACGSVVRWWTRLPLIVRLSVEWVKWALGLMVLACIGTASGGGLLVSLLISIGVSLPIAVIDGIFYVAFGLALGLAFLLLREHKPKVCPQCGCVS